MEWMERKLRGPLNAGIVPKIEQLSAEATSALAEGRPFSEGLKRQAWELGTSPEELSKGLPPELMRDVIQNASDRYQFRLGIGDIGDIYQTKLGRVLLSMKPFSISTISNRTSAFSPATAFPGRVISSSRTGAKERNWSPHRMQRLSTPTRRRSRILWMPISVPGESATLRQ